MTRFGGPEVLAATDLPNPAAGPEEVAIAVAVADTPFVETQVRSGWGADRSASAVTARGARAPTDSEARATVTPIVATQTSNTPQPSRA